MAVITFIQRLDQDVSRSRERSGNLGMRDARTSNYVNCSSEQMIAVWNSAYGPIVRDTSESTCDDAIRSDDTCRGSCN